MNTCAVCGRGIYKGGICSNCWKEWTITGAIPIENIVWLIELKRMHNKEEKKYFRRNEISLTELE